MGTFNKFSTLVAAPIVALGLSVAAPAKAVPVDAEILLLMDVSGSVNSTEFNLQRTGYANAFQSAAVHSGIRHAQAEWVATLDGDGQNDPADLPRLYALREQATLVIGNRVQRRDTWLRHWQSRIANGVRGRMLGDGTPDTGCGIKVMHRDTFLQLPYFDHMHRFLPALFQRAGASVLSVPVAHRPRERGTSKYGLFDRLWVGIVDIFGVMWLRRRYRPGLIVTEES